MANAIVDDLAEQITWLGRDVPAVCLLDTGINLGHPLFEPALTPGDMHAVVPTFGADDHSQIGHESGMAGLAVHGDLTSPLRDTSRPIMAHRLESLKILPPEGFDPNDPSS